MRPPKSAGREQFGGAYTAHFLEACRNSGGSAEDTIATATALTAQSVRLAYANFLHKNMHKAAVDFIVSGGGARNLTLMQMLRDELEPFGCTVQASDDLGCRRRPRRRPPLRCWPMRRGIGGREIFLRPPARCDRQSWARSPMFEASRVGLLFVLCVLGVLAGCGARQQPPQTVTMLIESSPTSLDLRIGVDAQSEHIGSLIFDSLVHKKANFTLEPWLATSWETPDPLTYRFHLRTDVHFHNGKPLTAAM